jgi:hypothetical protein
MRGWLTTLAVVVAVDVVLLLAADRRPEVTVVTLQPIGTASRSAAAPRGAGAGPAATTPTAGAAAPAITCTSPAPSPTWACQNGVWVMFATTQATGAGSAGSGAGNCLGVQPGAGWNCRGGVWTPPGDTSGSATPNPSSSPSQSTPPSQSSPSSEPNSTPAQAPTQPACTGPNPAAGIPGVVARCVNGSWVIGG